LAAPLLGGGGGGCPTLKAGGIWLGGMPADMLTGA